MAQVVGKASPNEPGASNGVQELLPRTEVTSGHSWVRKARFAGTLSSAFLAMAISSYAKDFYLEKFAADPMILPVLFTVISCLMCVGEIVSGRFQEQSALKRFFPVKSWGRKAPWLWSHTFVLAVAAAAVYLPPSRDTYLLHGWFFVTMVLINWAISTCIIAFESCRQEIYPYNEERANVEFFCKLSVGLGVALAALPMLVLLANADIWLRVGSSAVFFVAIVAFGAQAKSIWLEAKSDSISEQAPSIVRDFKLTWANKAFRHLWAVRFWEGMYQGLQATNLWYYITYIMQMHGDIRSLAVVGIGALSMACETIVAAVMGRLMLHKESSYRIQNWVVKCRLANIVVTLLLGVLPVLVSGAGPHATNSRGILIERAMFIAWIVVSRSLQGPFTFWRVGAQCWVVDEDIHLANGERREAAYISVASAAQNFTRAFAGSIGFLGYGIAGFAPMDCEGSCEPQEDRFACLSDCMELSIVSQPDSLRWYIRMVNVIGLVVTELLLVYHTWAFPINGWRLAKLYNNQTVHYGGVVETGSASIQLGKLVEMSSLSLHLVAQAQHSKSVVVMAADDPDAGKAHVSRLASSKAVGGVSTSVIFSDSVHAITGSRDAGAGNASARPEPQQSAMPTVPWEEQLSLRQISSFSLLRASATDRMPTSDIMQSQVSADVPAERFAEL